MSMPFEEMDYRIREETLERCKELILRAKELIEESRAAQRAFQTAKQRCKVNGFVPSVRPKKPILASPDA